MMKDSQELYTRAELVDAGKPWCSQASKQRASEYDAIYLYVRHHAVELSKARGLPTTVLQAAEDLDQIKGVCKKKSAGGISMYRFMKECEQFRREQLEARKAAKAAAAAAAADSGHEEQQQDDDDEEEVDGS